MNHSIFYILYNLSSIPIISKIALFLSYPFTYFVIFLLIIWAVFISQRKMYNFSLLFLSGLTSWLVSNILKNIIRMNRPFVDLNIIPVYKEIGFSFPSQHMAVFIAIATSMFFINRKAGYVFLIIAFLIGISRVIIGVHYPVDLLGGLVVGVLVSLIFIELFKKI